jgi:hypothetical protein
MGHQVAVWRRPGIRSGDGGLRTEAETVGGFSSRSGRRGVRAVFPARDHAQIDEDVQQL